MKLSEKSKLIEDFELKYIDVFWKQDTSKIDDNETIHVIKHMQKYRGVPCHWDIGFASDKLKMLLNCF